MELARRKPRSYHPTSTLSWGSEPGSGLSAYCAGRGAIQGCTPGLHRRPAIMWSDIQVQPGRPGKNGTTTTTTHTHTHTRVSAIFVKLYSPRLKTRSKSTWDLQIKSTEPIKVQSNAINSNPPHADFEWRLSKCGCGKHTLTPDNGALEHQNSWFSRIVVGHSCWTSQFEHDLKDLGVTHTNTHAHTQTRNGTHREAH